MQTSISLKDDDGNVLSVNLFSEYFHSTYSKDNDFLSHFDKLSNVLL